MNDPKTEAAILFDMFCTLTARLQMYSNETIEELLNIVKTDKEPEYKHMREYIEQVKDMS